MKIQEYLEAHGITLRDAEERIKEKFGNGPSHSTLAAIANGGSEPKLELALMIVAWSDGEITPEDLVQNSKRKYTAWNESIYANTNKAELDKLMQKMMS